MSKLAPEVAELYGAHAASLYRYAGLVSGSPEIARDALQEAFLRYLRVRSRGRQIRRREAWLFRVIRNCALDLVLEARSRAEVTLDQAARERDARDPERVYGGVELARLLAGRLTPRERACVLLRSQGLRYNEIAARLRVRPGTVGALIARAAQRLRHGEF